MKRLAALLGLCLLLFVRSFSQQAGSPEEMERSQIQELRLLFHYADSINKLGKPGKLDSSVFVAAGRLDKGHPAAYFERAAELAKQKRLNEACFLFYLGRLRYQYYNSVNPHYKSSEDGALAASLTYMLGEFLNLYLKTNVENFDAILKKSVEWYEKHDCAFYPKAKSPEKYKSQAQGLRNILVDLEANRSKYAREWADEIEAVKKNLNASQTGSAPEK